MGEVIYPPQAPASRAVAVTPSDSDDIPVTRALYVGDSGDVKVTMQAGDVVVFSDVPVGILPICVTRVWITGTGASHIVALY